MKYCTSNGFQQCYSDMLYFITGWVFIIFWTMYHGLGSAQPVPVTQRNEPTTPRSNVDDVRRRYKLRLVCIYTAALYKVRRQILLLLNVRQQKRQICLKPRKKPKR